MNHSHRYSAVTKLDLAKVQKSSSINLLVVVVEDVGGSVEVSGFN